MFASDSPIYTQRLVSYQQRGILFLFSKTFTLLIPGFFNAERESCGFWRADSDNSRIRHVNRIYMRGNTRVFNSHEDRSHHIPDEIFETVTSA